MDGDFRGGDYLGDLRHADHLLEDGPSRRILQATAATLSECLPPDLAADLRRLWPAEVRGDGVWQHGDGPLPVGVFTDRVRERGGLHRDEAPHHVRVALRLLADMMPQDVADRVTTALGAPYREFLDGHVGSPGAIAPAD